MNIIAITQIIVSVLLIALILLQQRGTEGLGSAFGGDGSGGAAYRTRRGAEKIIFIVTIALTVVFVALALLSVVRA